MKDGGPAFPRPPYYTDDGRMIVPDQDGMSLRDYFAAKAMQGMLAADGNVRYVESVEHGYQPGGGNWMNPEGVCAKAYEIADAMLAQRDKPSAEPADKVAPSIPPDTI